MYPWHHALSAWAKGAGLQIDALGLVTLLGVEEMDRSIGRLMPSVYFDYLPLLGAFVVAGDRFTERKLGYALYNISAGIVTTELSGWFSRWLRAQEFHKIRSKVTWELVDRPPRRKSFSVGLFLVSVPLHGMLLALTVLAADWWGFANVVAMIVSVLVRRVQVAENQAGIDENIRLAEDEATERLARYEHSKNLKETRQRDGKMDENVKIPKRPTDFDPVKIILVTEESKVLTLAAPAFLIKPAFTAAPRITRPRFYLICRIFGWVAFAVHVISIGMAALYTQICTVVLMITATVLTAYKVGCEDSRLEITSMGKPHGEYERSEEWSCWVTSRLKATISSYPVGYTEWEPTQGSSVEILKTQKVKETISSWPWSRGNTTTTTADLEHSAPTKNTRAVQERRQDLFAWLDLTTEEDDRMVAWHMIPHSQDWKDAYLEKKEIHRQRTKGLPNQTQPT
ncbi:hypothetical protein N7478_005135 [Penicillium angulare]|uniref:uncharacterized protein n=1 Tax=Penicillium angulare TaxID=116970 RepID=UPI00253F909F|nr:uncharacterized protein N7478_005135 [Penicillium angulare]KAJ5279763.1 hypothetical protein N7478_005135 [Penicillium angulare]